MKLLLTLLVCLMLCGCGAEDPGELSDPGWEEYQQGEVVPDKEVITYPEEFALAYHKDHTLDPITCGEGIQQDVSSLLYEPLYRLDERFEPTGVLCTGAQWDESGLVCTLNIRQGVLFSDGSELTAADVAATLRRAMESRRYAYRLRTVADIAYSNRNMTVTVTLLEKNRAFISLLDIAVVKKGTEDQMVPVGTGPYVFTTDDDGVYLAANGVWWQQKVLPVDRITLIHAKDESTAIHLFTSNRVELLTLDPTGGHGTMSGGIDETERATTLMHYIGFNTMSGVFADRAARAAFSAGIPRDTLVNAFLSKHAVAASFPVSPMSMLYPDSLDGAYSQEKTRDAIATAGYDTGESRELILLVNEEDSFRIDNADYIAQQLSVLDWKITVRVLPWTEYLVALEQGDFDLYYGQVRLCADWDVSDLVATTGAMNYGRFSDQKMDLLLSEFRQSNDRTGAAYTLYNYFAQMAPIAPVCFRNYTVLTHPFVVENMATAPDRTFGRFEEWTIHLAS
ncbi:MAG: ABC transporter substrate-binding protein [Oscillospiraceae bacterium]|nr:ABC transporter substrate-binding protein [Oscillospiraceae bacterium]